MPDYDAIIKAVENDKPLPKNVIDIPDVKESHTSYINRMQELNKHIAQLTELVNTGNEAIKSMETALKAAEEERDRLADQRRESEPKFERVNYFYSITDSCFLDEGKMNSVMLVDINSPKDDHRFEVNNYFHTRERADEVADKINFLLKLERLHDVFCPDFNLGLGDGLDVEKYYVYYNFVHEKWMDSCMIHASSAIQVYFPTKEIAQKVCDILNAELESEK